MRDASALVVGGGPAGLAAAEILSGAGAAVILADRMPSLGRKLLMAGRGGLNITHSEPPDAFLDRYGAARGFLEPSIERFGPAAMREWCDGLGQPSFIGSSGRVFPRAMKASPLLRAWQGRLLANGVTVRLRHRWIGVESDGALRFDTPEGTRILHADAVVLALGGASWSRLGSDGAWGPLLRETGIAVEPFTPSNCGFSCGWDARFAERFAGEPIKGVRLRFGAAESRGDLVLTRSGIEGGAVYPLAAAIRAALLRQEAAVATLDLRPDEDEAALRVRLSRGRPRDSLGNLLRKTLALSPASIALLREVAGAVERTPEALARRVKALPLRLLAPAPLDRAISTAGGVSRSALDANLMLRALPGWFCCGEMIDWDAPTGGYLLQASIATGRAAGEAVLSWLADGAAGPVAAPGPVHYPPPP